MEKQNFPHFDAGQKKKKHDQLAPERVGGVGDDKEQLKNMTVNFYQDLFTSEPEAGGNFMRKCFPPILEETRRELEVDYSLAETSKALKGMGSLKSPGPDGYQPLFFMKTWNLTGQDLHSFAQGVLGGGDFSAEAAEALLVLIPKVNRPTSIKGFRPVNLCNVSMKVISKMIVNRLKKVLDDIISLNQASFIPGRQSLDNIVLCQELIHTLS